MKSANLLRKWQQVRHAMPEISVLLKIALTQKFLCYFWKSAEERKTERSGQDSSRWLVGPSVGPPSFARCGCLLETDTLTVGRRTKRSREGRREAVCQSQSQPESAVPTVNGVKRALRLASLSSLSASLPLALRQRN